MLRRIILVPGASIVLLQGSKITPLVDSWSTMTIIESNPLDVGRSVMKSMVMREKGWACSDLTGCVRATVGLNLINS